MRGVPVAGQNSDFQWDAQGRLLELRQNGWLIAYNRYRERGGLHLPDKLKLERDAVKVRFVIDNWQTS